MKAFPIIAVVTIFSQAVVTSSGMNITVDTSAELGAFKIARTRFTPSSSPSTNTPTLKTKKLPSSKVTQPPTYSPSSSPSTSTPTLKTKKSPTSKVTQPPTYLPSSSPSTNTPTLTTKKSPTSKVTQPPTYSIFSNPFSLLPSSTNRLLPSPIPSAPAQARAKRFPTLRPSQSPIPTVAPTSTFSPSIQPTFTLTLSPTCTPKKSSKPTKLPTSDPIKTPTFHPTSPSTFKPTLATRGTATSIQTTLPSIPTKSINTFKPTPKTTIKTITPSFIPIERDISYHGGELLTGTVNVYNIYIGDFTSSPRQRKTTALVDYFTSHLGASDIYNIITSYYEIDANGEKVYISNDVRLAQSINLLPDAKGIKIDRLTIMQEIIKAINSRKLSFDTRGVYAVMIRGDFQMTGYLTDWCGFHSYIPIGGLTETLKYFVVGDVETSTNGYGYNCASFANNTANGSLGGDSIVNTYYHEITETVTDFYQGWYFDASEYCDVGCYGYENADMCNFFFDSDGVSNVKVGDKYFLVQGNWQPGYGCVFKKKE